jgi:hypothetical protein
MKKIGEYTCRGQVASEITERIFLDDGRFDTGFRITEFVIAANNLIASDDAFGTLFTDEAGAGTSTWEWQKNGQIAWSSTIAITGAAYSPFSVVDPDNLVVQDLYIRCKEVGGDPVNYMIKMEKYEFSEWRGALAMVRNNAQAV